MSLQNKEEGSFYYPLFHSRVKKSFFLCVIDIFCYGLHVVVCIMYGAGVMGSPPRGVCYSAGV